MCEWSEDSEDGLYTLGEMQQYLKDISEVEDNMNRTRWIKSKIIERYGKEHVIFTEICERRDVVCLRKMANHIINDKWYSDRQSSIEVESVRIVKRAARLIKDSICEVQYHISKSPTLEEIRDKDLTQQWVPHMLRTFMANLTANQLKQTSIGQSIVQGYCSKQLVLPASTPKAGRRIWCQTII